MSGGHRYIGLPCVIKPVMSSSGKGQSLVKNASDITAAWNYAQEGGRSGAGRIIVEGFVGFDYEITLLTLCHRDGTSFCEPIDHRQQKGDYRESWQPQPVSVLARGQAESIARQVTQSLGGWGLFGVELFVAGDQVIFSEVSPRPHDTGMVTMISQDLSEFALHVRAVLGLPIPLIRQRGPSASSVLLVEGITAIDVQRAGVGVAGHPLIRQVCGQRAAAYGRDAGQRSQDRRGPEQSDPRLGRSYCGFWLIALASIAHTGSNTGDGDQ